MTWCPVYYELFCYSWYYVNPGDWHLLLPPPPGFFFTSSWCLCWSRWSELIWPFEGALPVQPIPSAYSYRAFGYLDHTGFSLRPPHISLGCVEFSLSWTVTGLIFYFPSYRLIGLYCPFSIPENYSFIHVQCLCFCCLRWSVLFPIIPSWFNKSLVFWSIVDYLMFLDIRWDIVISEGLF